MACHITAAAKGGPRFNEKITQEQRKSIQNGIWLCQNCAKLIDVDTNSYSPDELLKWKSLAEKESLSVITNGNIGENQTSLCEKRIKVYEKLFYEIRDIDSLIKELIVTKEMSIQEKKDAAFYLGFQIAQFTDDNSFYLQNEIIIQCIGTFVGIDDIFCSNKKMNKENLENYNRNIWASQKLLKSVNNQGLIDVSKKTALMAYYSKVSLNQEKMTFFNH